MSTSQQKVGRWAADTGGGGDDGGDWDWDSSSDGEGGGGAAGGIPLDAGDANWDWDSEGSLIDGEEAKGSETSRLRYGAHTDYDGFTILQRGRTATSAREVSKVGPSVRRVPRCLPGASGRSAAL